MAAVALTGTRRGARRTKGRAVGQVPAPLQGYQTGSLAFYAPASAIGLGLLYLLWRPIRLPLSAPARAAALILGMLLYVSGLALFLWGRLALAAEFGEQWAEYCRQAPAWMPRLRR